MKYTFVFGLFLLILLLPVFAQQPIETHNIEIVRDEYGVPHIFTKTDVEAVYGIAWAQCEDNFNIIQDDLAATKGMAGRLMGKDGAALDFIYEVFRIEEFVEQRYQKDIVPQIEKMLLAYSDAINKYADIHPEEVKNKKLFPITPKEILGSHTLHMFMLSNSLAELGKLMTKDYEFALLKQAGGGSNAMAFSPNITSDGKSYLIGNPHQPVNSIGNFWEVSVHSEEGYEMYGATLSSGGIIPVLGTNRNLGWSHTTNWHNTADIYHLEMHPTKKNFYKYDDEYLELEEKSVKLKVKVAGIVLPVKKKYYWSKYGPTFQKESGYYSCKFSALHNLKLIETWYKMGLSKNMDEFTDAINTQGLPSQTITYADKTGNIYHLSNFIHPFRDESFDWSNVLKGNTSKNNWNLESYHPISDLPQVKNPKCGYVYDCNSTVFKMTAPDENPSPEDFPKSFNLLKSNTIRGKTFAQLIKGYDKISFEEARKIRESTTIDKEELSFRMIMNGDDILRVMNARPELSAYKKVYDKWDGSFDITNKQASLMAVTSMYYSYYIIDNLFNTEQDMPEAEIVEAMQKAMKFLKKHYGTLEVELGEVQKAVRDDMELPMYGGPNTLANAHFEPYKKGKIKLVRGDSFIFYAKYGKDGLEELETVNAFGNSTKKGHPHSTDQTELYVNLKTKMAELNLEKLKRIGKSYHPK